MHMRQENSIYCSPPCPLAPVSPFLPAKDVLRAPRSPALIDLALLAGFVPDLPPLLAW